jgi:lysine 6-dehydrogenase
MASIYAILGSGMQGTATAYDMARFGDAATILMGDVDLEQANRNAARVNELVGSAICDAKCVDALDEAELSAFLEPVDVVASCVPYWMHPRIAPIAIQTNTSMIDMGGDTEVTLETMKFDGAAKAAGVSIIPDTGLAPGLVNSLATHLMSLFDETEEVRLYCGGLPQNPNPPFNYKLVFNIEGLVAEYTDDAYAIRDGELARPATLSDLEEIDWPGLGRMEAFVTSGGTSTAPHTFLGSLKTYEYKTIRFPGHCNLMRLFMDFGFWSLDPILVDGAMVRPRELFHKVMGPALSDPSDSDQILVRAVANGTRAGRSATHKIDIWDKQDPVTGFSAMERMTGFPSSINAIEIARGNVAPGVVPYELAVPGTTVVSELKRRGISIIEA